LDLIYIEIARTPQLSIKEYPKPSLLTEIKIEFNILITPSSSYII